MAPIVGVRTYQEMEVNRANVQKLENFYIINECADQYTNVNTQLIEEELDYAHDLSKIIAIWFWITVSMIVFECCTGCLGLCIDVMFMGKFSSSGGNVLIEESYVEVKDRRDSLGSGSSESTSSVGSNKPMKKKN